MNKNDVIAAVAEKTGMSKAAAGQAVDSTFEVITSALKSGDDVKVIGFGSFCVANRAASMDAIRAPEKRSGSLRPRRRSSRLAKD